MPEPVILTGVRESVATITLNRPDKLNAVNGELLTQAASIVKAWSRDPEIGAIVITGSGRAFCAGGDVSMMAGGNSGVASGDFLNKSTLEERIDGLREAQELSWLLTHYAGAPKAKELFFLADPIDADEARRIGLVNRVAEPEQLMETALLAAKRIANGPLTSYRYMKANVNLAATVDFRAMLDREAETHLRCGETEDHREGVRAFMEKREPQFKGR